MVGDGCILEFVIGMGWVVFFFVECGVEIEGIDVSFEMVVEFCKKLGGEEIFVVIGDMVDVFVEGLFDFIFLIFNMLFNFIF